MSGTLGDSAYHVSLTKLSLTAIAVERVPSSYSVL